MRAPQRRGDPAEVHAALARVLDDQPTADDLRLLTRHFLAELSAAAPGRSVELRVPPYGATQCVSGTRHTRGTPSAVVETDPLTWVLLATGRLGWVEACRTGRLHASGERSDLSHLLPVADG
jgi:hypothetical protein